MNRKILLIVVALLANIFCFVGCKGKSDPLPDDTTQPQTMEEMTQEPTQEPTASGDNIDKGDSSYSDDEIFEQLFDINNRIEIDIDITDEELAKIQEDYEKYAGMGSKSPIYRETTLSITITTDEDSYTYKIENAGIRMKGNTSRTDFYNSNEGQYNLIHFRVKFPEEFAGLENLEIKWNKCDDTTYIREYYAYGMFRDNGILAPHTNLASVDVAGIHEGVFTICEPVDKLFIEKNLPEEDWDGDLYKCGWTWDGAMLTSSSSIGIENEDACEFYNYDLKNNKKTSNHEVLTNLIEELNDGDVSREELEELVDMDYFLRFAAVSYFVGNPDDIRYNFNNHYIYFLKSSNKAIIIPYDNDRCLGVTKEWNPTGDAMTTVNPFSTMADGGGYEQRNPLFIYTVDAGGYYIDEYADELAAVADSEWLTTDRFKSIYEIAYNNYKDDTTPDKVFYNAGGHKFRFDLNYSEGLSSSGGNASFAEYIGAKLSSYNKYISEIDKYYDQPVGNVNNEDVNYNDGSQYYIRGTFTDWNIREEYKMSYDEGNNAYSFNLTVHEQESLKINNGDNGGWYGYECITVFPEKDCVHLNEKRSNIIVDPGEYEIIFRGDDHTIEISLINE